MNDKIRNITVTVCPDAVLIFCFLKKLGVVNHRNI